MDFSSLPRHPNADSDRPTEIPCEGCGKYHPGSRSTSLLTIVFLVVFVYTRTDRVSLCPACARAALVRGTLFNLFTANLISPIVLIFNGLTFVGTFFRRTSWETPVDPDSSRQLR
jgi:hypothetical protein